MRARNVKIGEGRPKIIVSTTGHTQDQVLEEGRVAANFEPVDILELRVDLLDFAMSTDQVAELGKAGVDIERKAFAAYVQIRK